MKIFLATILIVINLFSQDIDTNLQLTTQEKEFIEKTHFNVAITKNWYPISFEEDKDKALGISSEIWEIIVNKLNLKTSNTFFNSFDEQIKSLQSGKSDIIFSVGESESRKKFAYFSNEYLKFPISIVTKKDENFIENIDEILDKKIAVGNNFTAHNLLKEKYPNIDLVLVNNVEEGLALVSKKEVFAFVDIKPILTYNIAKFEFKDLKVSGNSGIDFPLKIMVRKEYKDLIPIINKTIATIPASEVTNIVNSCNNVKFQTSIDYTIVWILTFVVFFSIIAFIHRTVTLNILNKKLKYTVEEKTKELRYLNENLQLAIDKKTKELLEKEAILNQQAKMAAMGEMIENIAHQWRQPLSVISTISSSLKIKKEMNILDDKEFYEALKNINKTSEHLSNTIDDFRNFFSPNKEMNKFYVSQLIKKSKDLIKSRFDKFNIKVIEHIDDIEILSYQNELFQVILNLFSNSIDVLSSSQIENKIIYIKIYHDENNLYIEFLDNGGGIKDEFINRVFEPYFTTKHKSQGTGIGLYMSLQIVTKHLNGEISVKNDTFIENNTTYFGAKFTILLPINLQKN
ncbi:transporter substrate-binding domain-containing protein [Aliarcobacter cryaerophilus]|uniref:transporter substrate-binding domain-containing protein n=1 Tax=Aliarcobacter cryaerophilus TaxID=28198 RepID=UPI0021B2A66D|nr:transporter substrate-binding domain-containing protein [Aliarcobacter cryaerophilus]MCT7468039.1 transporter substrate-binding domain-containing protein [Aliarcobacter cryaerophilus]